MADPQKDYLVKIFLKVSSLHNVFKKSVNFYFKFLSNSHFDISEERLERLKKYYSIDEYIDRLIPIISSQFTTEELKELISFYSKGLGKKIVNLEFTADIKKIGDDLFLEMENEFGKKNV